MAALQFACLTELVGVEHVCFGRCISLVEIGVF
jgi:hypothetical protein